MAQRSECCVCKIERCRQRRGELVWKDADSFSSPEETFPTQKARYDKMKWKICNFAQNVVTLIKYITLQSNILYIT